MNVVKEQEIRYCQSCLEKGETTLATREWQVGIYNCDACFQAKINSLTSFSQDSTELTKVTSIKVPDEKPNDFKAGPILNYLYELYKVPVELQFDSVDEVCRNYDKIFNFYAPAVINRTEENLAMEIEQLAMSLFYIKYRIEPLTLTINKLKEKRRIEKGLKNYDDSKEDYAKGKPKTTTTKTEKLAAKAGMGSEAMAELIKKAREREFNIMAGNCPECGGSVPCKEHPSKS